MAKTNGRKKKTLTLTQALAQFLSRELLPDLKERADQAGVKAALQRQHAAERGANRTADGFIEWQGRTLEQVGAAWVLSCVFVRTLEDRGLLGQRRLAGPGAGDSEQLFFELAPSLTARDYLLEVFREVGSLPGAEDLLGPRHNPAWRLSPSNEAARKLLEFFREPGETGEGLAWEFGGGDTRFLGDLYQDLSEEVRKRYALLQTPDFVERFILDQTLEPAIGEFGLKEVRVIDPTCGSGHFLLGAFDRLVDHRLRSEPGVDVRDHALGALAQVYGVDVNPYAVAIARFRLTLAYLEKTGIAKLAQAPKLPLNLVVADSLLHGGKGANLLLVEQPGIDAEGYKAWGAEIFALDDPEGARAVFGQKYHAVVGNPPYINVPDAALRTAYREKFPISCHRTYQLVSPFLEFFFQLGVSGGYVGAIVGNGFMKREFGRPLVEEVLPKIDLTAVIDTSGAYIPGHGTPTAILFGRSRHAADTRVRAVLGKRGEPSTPTVPSEGLVWSSIEQHLGDVGFENDFVSVVDAQRENFAKHPWSLGGGGAAELKQLLEDRADRVLGDLIQGSIGRAARTGDDDVYSWPAYVVHRGLLPDECWRRLLVGESVRDWSAEADDYVIFPYDQQLLAFAPTDPRGAALQRFLWPWRTRLRKRATFQGDMGAAGLHWYEYMQYTPSANATPLSIAFAFVATHNHFVLDRGGKVFNRSAPIIKLPESATEDDHLALLAYLNSSTACFFARQVLSPKGMHNGSKANATPFLVRFEWDGTKLKSFPLPDLREGRLVELGRALDSCASERAGRSLKALLADKGSNVTEGDLVELVEKRVLLMKQAVAIQEEIDWEVYALFDLVATDANSSDGQGPESLGPGDRPFEHLLATTDSSSFESGWFFWNEYRPSERRLTELEQRRLNYCRTIPELRMLESPECKRRWVQPRGKAAQELESDTKVIRDEVRIWLADELEEACKSNNRPLPMRGLVQSVASQPVARRCHSWAYPGVDLEETLRSLVHEESAPFVDAHLLTDEGVEVKRQWRDCWRQQREHDLGLSQDAILPPQKFPPGAFRSHFFSLRGPLNVPRERFISYPGCEKDSDPTPLIGWAGWNHLQRAQAIIVLYQERKNEDGWPAERLMPMLVGLHELMFWLELWHSKPEAGSQNPAAEFKAFLDAELATHKLAITDLEAWRPGKAKMPAVASKGRRSKAAKAAEPTSDDGAPP